MDKLVNELTQKDENKALKAALDIIEQENITAFKKLCEKSDFLFDFVKNNVCNRLKKSINNSNYRKVLSFFDIYNEAFSTSLIEKLSNFADEDLTDEIYEFLENGSLSQKKYAAKYFQFIPDTISLDLLEKYALSDDIELAVNSAQALGSMKDNNFYNSIISKLNTVDEFELIKYVRFLSAFGNKSAVKPLLDILETTSTAENIAAEIPYLEPFTEMLNTQDSNKVLTCFDFVLSGLGEIFNLGDIFFYEIYDVLEILINEQKNKKDSHVALVLLRALDKFLTFTSNDEYSFDEAKDTKDEIQAIFQLLNSFSEDFWNEQKQLISKEFQQTKSRIVATLEVIQALKIKNTTKEIINFLNSTNDEQLIVMAVGVLSNLNEIKTLDFEKIEQKISDSTLKAILKSYKI